MQRKCCAREKPGLHLVLHHEFSLSAAPAMLAHITFSAFENGNDSTPALRQIAPFNAQGASPPSQARANRPRKSPLHGAGFDPLANPTTPRPKAARWLPRQSAAVQRGPDYPLQCYRAAPRRAPRPRRRRSRHRRYSRREGCGHPCRFRHPCRSPYPAPALAEAMGDHCRNRLGKCQTDRSKSRPADDWSKR